MQSPRVHSSNASAALSELLEGLLASPWGQTASWQSKRSLVRAISASLGGLKASQVTYPVLERQVNAWAAEGLAPATINRRLSAIRQVLQVELRRGNLAALPDMPHQRENNRKEEYLSAEDEPRLLAQLGPTYAALVIFLVDTGARLGEALALKPEHVHDDAVLFVNTKSTRGGFKARRVPLTERAREAAEVIAGARFPSSSAVSQRLSGACRSIGLVDVTAHTLRHTCASRLLNGGASLVEVRDWLGHTSVTVTERYAHLERGKLNHLINTLEA